MIIERVLISIIHILLGSGAYMAFKRRHVRQLGNREMISEQSTAVDYPSIGNPLTVLYFRSQGCAACPAQARYLQQLDTAWNGRLAIRKIDADIEPEKAAQYGVFTLPTTIIMDAKGVVRDINYGLTNVDKLNKQLASVL
jgi:thiol-disulfide isomerase/thioredoxin